MRLTEAGSNDPHPYYTVRVTGTKAVNPALFLPRPIERLVCGK